MDSSARTGLSHMQAREPRSSTPMYMTTTNRASGIRHFWIRTKNTLHASRGMPPERPRHEGDVHEQGRRVERRRAGFEGVAQREAGGNRACEHQRERHSLSNSSAISASTSASNRKKPLLIFSTPR